MANCEKNILDLPLRLTAPALTDVFILTHVDGTSEIITWAVILASLSPTDILFQVGDLGWPQDGDSSYQNNVLIGRRVRMYRNKILQSTIDAGDGFYYSFNSVIGTITFSPILSEDEIIQIQAY